jgi:hypothetical protein
MDANSLSEQKLFIIYNISFIINDICLFFSVINYGFLLS